jgi:septum formation protein
MYYPLLLASSSPSRRYLLEQACMPFHVIKQTADEKAESWDIPIDQLVLRIARQKMDHVVFPEDLPTVVYVVTADTLTHDGEGKVYGKPESREEARANIQKFQKTGIGVVTGMCVARFEKDSAGSLVKVAQEEQVVSTLGEIDLPDAWIDWLFEHQPIALSAAGGIALEGCGMQFLKAINGSYSNTIGLPLCELRQSLEKLGYYAT